nr:hypothetical protein GCM10020093_011660 [Planobispora longispora]
MGPAGPPRGDVPTADDKATNFFRVAGKRRPPVAARLLAVVNRSLALVLLAGIWEALPRIGAVDAVFVPPLSEILAAWYDLLLSGQLLEHFQASLIRSLSGFGMAILLAIPLGLAIGWYRPVAEFLSPVLELFRNTSAVALLPVFILIFGLGRPRRSSSCSTPAPGRYC